MSVGLLFRVVLMGVVLGASPLGAEVAEVDVVRRELAHAVERLGDERFPVREQAHAALRAAGLSALPALEEALGSDSPERRHRAGQLIEQVRREFLEGAFRALGQQADEEIDVVYGMWLVALILDPALRRQDVTAQLDRLADQVRQAAGNGPPLAARAPGEAMDLLIGVLRDEIKLRGDTDSYDHPDNSSVARVLARRKGLPIVLSEIAVAVGRRLDLPLVGLGIPGRYMMKYDGKRAPAGREQADIIVNPFEDWRVMTVAELERTVPGFDADSDLQGSAPRATILRMLSNLYSDLGTRSQYALQREVRAYQVLVLSADEVIP